MCELVRVVRSEVLLWAPPLKLSQQAFSARLGSLPAELFLRVLLSLLPLLHTRWQERQRPLPPVIAWAHARYAQLAVCDGSTLDALIRKVGLLRDRPANPLAGRMTALLDLGSRLPLHLWYEADAQAHDQRFWPKILATLRAGALLLFDLGYTAGSFTPARRSASSFCSGSCTESPPASRARRYDASTSGT